MRAVVVGFPKSGTSTLHYALVRSGLRALHQVCDDGQPVGGLVYEGLARHGDPFHFFPDVDVLTQMDVCQPTLQQNFWPNLDLAVLMAIREHRPECRIILNRREPAAIARSIARWYDLQARIVESDIPGLPRGYGGTMADLEGWVVRHYAAVEALLGGSPTFLDLEMTSAEAPARLGAFLGVEIAWWGRANQSRPRRPPATRQPPRKG